MLEKALIVDILRSHLGENVDESTIDAIANELLSHQEKEWEEVHLRDEEMGYSASLELVDVCLIDRLLNEGYEVKIFKSKKPVRPPGEVERRYHKFFLGQED